MSPVEELSFAERIERYREHAARMMKMANRCSSEEMRLAYLRLAADWQSLVLDLEQTSLRESVQPSSKENRTGNHKPA